ncbi:MAG: right-handed parallel beta-helix repeat-containing protein [Phycisphaerae bacterium]|nr:right-handed parallel beta-helix repeat-containing protein [Phycisphaerae bacterium]
MTMSLRSGSAGFHRFVFVAAAALGFASPLFADLVIPTDGMVVTTNTTLVPGTYSLPNGLVIGASKVVLDLNGSTLVGSGGVTYGVQSIGHSSVSIVNGTIKGYYYGVRAENGSSVIVTGCTLSDNYVDPASLGGGAPFLNINVGPTLPNLTNLGGGLYLRNVVGATVTGNTMRNGENGIDLFDVTGALVSDNDCSHNTGWGIHLNASLLNIISDNNADSCTRAGLGDSAGILLVNGSSSNQILNNSFRFSGDGFFIGNEHGCPSNDNLIQGNDGSGAGANAFEATFSSGNQFIGNTANGSNYGFWLGYSHSGNVVRGNEIRANNTNGIEIEHGQGNVIEDNLITGNGGKGIVLRTDGSAPFSEAQFPCLDLPNQSQSTGYTIRGNVIKQNFGKGIELVNTTNSVVVNNLVGANGAGQVSSNGSGVTWASDPAPGPNIVGGPTLGGNYWSDYAGVDLNRDGIGDTLLPYNAGGAITPLGDGRPLVGNPDLGGYDNPLTHCSRAWLNYGANTRAAGGTFQTSNGAHYATNGTDLYLLEGTNGVKFDLFQPGAGTYLAKANITESVEDGGDIQWGGSLYFAGVGLSMNQATGSGKGPKLYAYNPATNTWAVRASCILGGKFVVHEALAFDPVGNKLYATVTNVQTGGDASLKQKLAIYNITTNAWIGSTAAVGFDWTAGTDAEYLDGKIYVWRGGFAGGNVNGSDSYLNVYDIATNTWSTTPSLQSSGVLPGFRSGGFDVWGITLSADAANQRMYVVGAETNKLLYVFDVATQGWRVAPTAPYDGGWGGSMEFVALSERVYVLDGRNAGGTTQGTAALVPGEADINRDDHVNATDLALMLGAWGECASECCPADIDESGTVSASDIAILLGAWTG